MILLEFFALMWSLSLAKSLFKALTCNMVQPTVPAKQYMMVHYHVLKTLISYTFIGYKLKNKEFFWGGWTILGKVNSTKQKATPIVVIYYELGMQNCAIFQDLLWCKNWCICRNGQRFFTQWPTRVSAHFPNAKWPIFFTNSNGSFQFKT